MRIWIDYDRLHKQEHTIQARWAITMSDCYWASTLSCNKRSNGESSGDTLQSTLMSVTFHSSSMKNVHGLQTEFTSIAQRLKMLNFWLKLWRFCSNLHRFESTVFVSNVSRLQEFRCFKRLAVSGACNSEVGDRHTLSILEVQRRNYQRPIWPFRRFESNDSNLIKSIKITFKFRSSN